MASPYEGLEKTQWRKKTERLIAEHPLQPEVIREVAEETWGLLWQTRIGANETAIRLEEIDPPATIVGYLFEKLFARALARRFPEVWRGTASKEEKDLVCLNDPRFSTEIKTSGQPGTKIYGNRSYGKKGTDAAAATLTAKAEKSGYYITVNFYGQTLTLIRFGWIDVSDWRSQVSETGQAAALTNEAYRYKLRRVTGGYQQNAPVTVLKDIAGKRAAAFATEGITTLYDLLQYEGTSKTLLRFKKAAESFVEDQWEEG